MLLLASSLLDKVLRTQDHEICINEASNGADKADMNSMLYIRKDAEVPYGR